jgi:hypothetical protein
MFQDRQLTRVYYLYHVKKGTHPDTFLSRSHCRVVPFAPQNMF